MFANGTHLKELPVHCWESTPITIAARRLDVRKGTEGIIAGSGRIVPDSEVTPLGNPEKHPQVLQLR
jgi:hypothetical protein